MTEQTEGENIITDLELKLNRFDRKKRKVKTKLM